MHILFNFTLYYCLDDRCLYPDSPTYSTSDLPDHRRVHWDRISGRNTKANCCKPIYQNISPSTSRCFLISCYTIEFICFWQILIFKLRPRSPVSGISVDSNMRVKNDCVLKNEFSHITRFTDSSKFNFDPALKQNASNVPPVNEQDFETFRCKVVFFDLSEIHLIFLFIYLLKIKSHMLNNS